MSTRISIVFVSAVAFALLTFAGSADSDSTLPTKECQDCHGVNGVSTNPKVPTIAGVSSFVTADYLYAFLDGARTCSDPEYTEKCAIKNDLTEEQIEGLGEHYAGMKFKPATQQYDADKAALGADIHADKCDKCHSDGGANPDDDASIIAGQWMPYLQASMDAFASGTRDQPSSMKRKVDELSPADIEALVHYYGSQQ